MAVTETMPDLMPSILSLLLPFLAAAAVSFVATPIVRRFAQTVGAIDVPSDDRRMHREPIPRLGGLAIFFGFLVAVLVFGDLVNPDGRIFGMLSTQMVGILLGSVVIVILGVVDDILRIRAWVKLVVQIMAAIIPVLYEVRIDRFSNPLALLSEESYVELGVFSIPITIIWIVLITNAVNLIDGLDGLAVGVSAISAISLLTISIIMNDMRVAIVMAALTGACLGFLPFNLNPAKMFMGDTGSTFLGFTLATVSILGLFKSYAIISFAVPFLILGLPIFDTIYAIVRRVSHGKSPMVADRSHVHHRLVDLGFSQKQAVGLLYILSVILGLVAVVLISSGAVKAMLVIFAVLLVIVVAVRLPFLNRGKSDGTPDEAEAIETDGGEAASVEKIRSDVDSSGAEPSGPAPAEMYESSTVEDPVRETEKE